MIANGYNSQTIQPLQQLQPPQSLQTIKPTQPKPQASPKDKERTNKCVQNWRNQLSNKKIVHSVEFNRLIIPIQDNINNNYKSIISVHCQSKPTHKWLFVSRETFEKYHADIYLGYDPSTPQPQPEGFAMRKDLFLTEWRDEVGAPLYGIMRAELDPNIGKLFDLNYLLKNSQLEPTQLEPISYV